MRFVIQRVTEATCEVDQKITGQITNGFCVLIGIAETDVQTGIFGADMKISLVNDGPFTILLDSEDLA